MCYTIIYTILTKGEVKNKERIMVISESEHMPLMIRNNIFERHYLDIETLYRLE